MADHKRLNLLNHPLSKKLIKYKWYVFFNKILMELFQFKKKYVDVLFFSYTNRQIFWLKFIYMYFYNKVLFRQNNYFSSIESYVF